jgi:hypothetical protein
MMLPPLAVPLLRLLVVLTVAATVIGCRRDVVLVPTHRKRSDPDSPGPFLWVSSRSGKVVVTTRREVIVVVLRGCATGGYDLVVAGNKRNGEQFGESVTFYYMTDEAKSYYEQDDFADADELVAQATGRRPKAASSPAD